MGGWMLGWSKLEIRLCSFQLELELGLGLSLAITRHTTGAKGCNFVTNFDLFQSMYAFFSFYWRERAAGNDEVATIFLRIFFSFFSPFFFPVFPPSQPFLIDGVLGSKNLFSKSCLEHPKLGIDQTPAAICGSPGGQFGFCRRWGIAGSVALQAVSECQQCC